MSESDQIYSHTLMQKGNVNYKVQFIRLFMLFYRFFIMLYFTYFFKFLFGLGHDVKLRRR